MLAPAVRSGPAAARFSGLDRPGLRGVRAPPKLDDGEPGRPPRARPQIPAACEVEAVITCPKCFKENQDHYKFCLGCGAELPRDVSPKKFAPGTPPHGVPAAKAAPAFAIADEVTSVGIPSGPEVRPKPPPRAPWGHGGHSPRRPQRPARCRAHRLLFAPPPHAAPPAPTGRGRPSAVAVPQAPAPGWGIPPPAPGSRPRRLAAARSICPQCGSPEPAQQQVLRLLRLQAGPPGGAPARAGARRRARWQPSGVVLTALRADGTEAGTYALPVGIITVSRDRGAIFAGDSYLLAAPRHLHPARRQALRP